MSLLAEIIAGLRKIEEELAQKTIQRTPKFFFLNLSLIQNKITARFLKEAQFGYESVKDRKPKIIRNERHNLMW